MEYFYCMNQNIYVFDDLRSFQSDFLIISLLFAENDAKDLHQQRKIDDSSAKKKPEMKQKRLWDYKKESSQHLSVPIKKKKPESSSQHLSVPNKKNKPENVQNAKNPNKFYCIECFEASLQGKMEERCASICRIDKSSVDRHKLRWHCPPKKESCTFVPSDASEVHELRRNYSKSKSHSTNDKSKRLLPVSIKPGKSSSGKLPATPENSLQVSEDMSSKRKEETVTTELSVSDDEIDVVHEEVDQFGIIEQSKNETLVPLRLDDTGPMNYSATYQKTGQKSLLQFKISESKDKDVSLEEIVDAIEKLTIKVDDIGQKHARMTQLACEDSETSKSIIRIKNAQNISQVVEATNLIEWYYDEVAETGVLRCLPCYQLNLIAKPTLQNMHPLKAQQLLSSSSTGTLATGMFMSRQKTRLLLTGHNTTWYHLKNSCFEHLSLIGTGSITHKRAMDNYKKISEIDAKRSMASKNIFRCAIVDLKLNAAGTHLETLISFLAQCGVNVGNVGHGRKNFNDILYCLEKTVNKRTTDWLSRPLPSTMLPPHFWATVDKGTPSRTTNQATIIVARDASGIPCPIPVASPVVYSNFEPASYSYLAELLLNAIKDNFSSDVISRLCGIAADGPYQASGFREKILEQMGIENGIQNQLDLPVSWDAAHLINLGVLDVKDSKTNSGKHFQTFVKRCNIFNTVMAHGKGFAFLQLVDSTARRPVSYASQRFTSSAYDQWLKIEKSYESYWKAFEILYPNREEEEEYQYMIGGSDFVSDLLAFLDTMKPVVELMLRVQSLDTPIWKLKCWWPKVEAVMEKKCNRESGSFPRLEKVREMLKPGKEYKGVTLLPGWLITEVEGTKKNKVYTWKLREEEEITDDQITFAEDLMLSIGTRIQSAISDEFLAVLEVFDAQALVNLHCGKKVKDVQLEISDGDYDSYGVEECKKIMMSVSRMKHIQESGMDFDQRLAHRYMNALKESIFAGIWKNLCPEWFLDEKNVPLKQADLTLVEFESIESNLSTPFDATFKMVFNDGTSKIVRLHEQSVYRSFYKNKDIYSIAKPPACTLLDIVLAKGGPEAIAESYYSTMRSQQQPGGQANETLARRTKLSWCLPSLKQCEDIISDSVSIYQNGDDKIRPHRRNTFFSSRHASYDVSKVVDRVDSAPGRCPFLATSV